MRISTNLIYQQGVSAMQRQQAELAKTQQRMSLGTRMLAPSDDPVAAARLIAVDQASATNDQYKANRGAARSALGLEENVLASIGNTLQQVRTTAVYAGNPTLTDSDRAALVIELNSRFEQLMGLANSTDGTGQYLFSGYKGATPPFSGTGAAVAYNGDQGQRLMQAGPSRQLAVSDSGSDVFQRIRTGNGTFYAQAGAAAVLGNPIVDTNNGTGVISAGSVTDPAALLGHSYEIRFDASATSYSIYDLNGATPAVPIATNPYVSGATIGVDGMEVQITGAPAADDKFTLTPSSSQSMFKTVSDLISAVGAKISSPADSTRLANAVSVALKNIDQSLDKVLSVRADVGARLQELDSLDDLGDGMALQYSKTSSELKNLDYAAATSDLARQQMILEAAQRSFAKIAGMSLFDFL